MERGSYRGIKLMGHAMKVLDRVVYKRVREMVEIAGMQSGLMKVKGTTYVVWIVTVRQIQEKMLERHNNLTTVPRKVKFGAQGRKYLVPEQIVRLVEEMYNGASTIVRTECGVCQQSS